MFPAPVAGTPFETVLGSVMANVCAAGTSVILKLYVPVIGEFAPAAILSVYVPVAGSVTGPTSPQLPPLVTAALLGLNSVFTKLQFVPLSTALSNKIRSPEVPLKV